MKRPTRNNRPRKSAKKRAVKLTPQKKRTTFAGKFEYGQCEPRILLSANDPPVNVVPGDQTTQVDTPIAFTAYRDNLVSTSDPDAGLNPVEVTLTAEHGHITLLNPDPDGLLTYSEGDGFEDVTMTFTGRLDSINTALQWVSFQPDADYLGTATMTITTNDQGYFGTGGPQEDTDTINIEVTEVPAFDPPPTWTTFPAALDTSFDEDGMQTLSLSDGSDAIYDMRELEDGKILAAGEINSHFGIMRFNPDMTLDQTFGTGGFTETDLGTNSHAYTMEFDKEGRILIAGNHKIVRYSADGTLDTTFGDGGAIDNAHIKHIWQLAFQPDGEFIVAGSSDAGQHGDGDDFFRLTRYLSDGTPDNNDDENGSFDANGNLLLDLNGGHNRDNLRGMQIYDNGNILLLGKGGNWNGGPFTFHSRLLNNNADFLEQHDIDLPSEEYASTTLALPDGKHLIVGYDNSGNDDSDVIVTRHLRNGATDTTFGTDGSVKIPVLNLGDKGFKAALQADGKIVLTGHSNNGDNWDLTVVRMTHDGVLDTDFNGNGKLHIPFSGENDYAYSILSLPDGKILVAGQSGNDIALVKLLGDSNQDGEDANDPPVNVVPGDQTTQVDTPIAFTAYRDNLVSTSDPDAGLNPVEVTLTAEHGHITLLNPDPDGLLTYSEGDGFEDVTMTFTGRLDSINTALQWVSFQPDADYLGTATMTITTNDQGYFGTGGPQEDTDTINIEVTEVPAFDPPPTWTTFPAALDTSFDEDGMQTLSLSDGSDAIYDMRELEDGKILAAGEINSHFGIMRFNPDMTLDQTFGTGGFTETDLGTNSHAYTMEFDKEGRILIAGNHKIVRYSADGTLDTTFGDGGAIDNAHIKHIWQLAFQPDGEFIVAGSSDAGQHGDGDDFFRLTRYLSDGTPDNNDDENGSFDANGNLLLDLNGGHNRDNLRGMQIYDNGNILLLGKGGNWNGGPFTFHSRLLNNNADFLEQHDIDLPSEEYASTTLALPDGKHLIVGYDNSGNDDSDVIVTRHLRNGATDTTFGTDGSVKIPVLNLGDKGFKAALQADGKIVLTGHSNNGDNWDLTVVRMTHDGVLDTDFNGNGKLHIPFSGENDYAYSILSLPDGKILVAGQSGNDIALVKLLGDSNQDGEDANDPPVNVVPGDQTTQVDTPIAFTAYRDNLVSTSDPDAGLNPVEVTLTAEHGHITLLNPDPDGLLTYSEGDGFEDVTMTFTGRLDSINTALQWVSFQPDADYLGTATMTITTNDQGYFGTGGPQEDTDTINIEVTEVPAFDPPPTWTTFPAALDTSFDEDGMQTLSLSDGSDAIYDMRELEDGKILAAGEINSHFGIMRFNPDMTLDQTFGTGGFTETDLGTNSHAYTMEFDKEGRILIAGNHKIVRYSADGTLDTTFGDGGAIDNAHIKHIWQLAFQPDGEFIVAGSSDAGQHGDGDDFFRLTRYLSDGTPDNNDDENGSFDANGNLLLDLNGGHNRDNLRGMQIYDNGNILLLGKGGNWNGGPFTFHSRLLNNNADFLEQHDIDLPSEEYASTTLALPDGKHLIVGYDNSGNDDSDVIVTRHLRNGATDTTFGTDGSVKIPVLNLGDKGFKAALQADGKIVLTGHSNNGDNWDLTVVRMTHDGVLDTDFNGNGKLHIPFSGENDYAYSILSLPDGKILVAGQSGNDIALVKLLGDSNQDGEDANDPPVNVVPGDQTTQVDTPIAFTAYRDNLVSTSDPDAGLNPVEVTLTAEHGHITLLNPDPDGLLTYSEGDGFEDVTMTFTGRLDSINTALQWVSFQPDADYLGTATMTITTNDQGYFGTGGPQEDTDTINIEVTEVPAFDPPPTWTTFPAALDTSFDEDGMQTLSLSDGSDAIYDMRELEDGKILAAGEINSHFGIMRFNPDMTLDQTFGTGGFTETDLGTNSHAYTMEFDKEGRILIAGNHKIVRYSADGTLDTTFGDGGAIDNAHIKHIWQLAFQPDGEFIVAGSSDAGQHGDGDDFFRLTRYLSDGTPDNNDDENGSFDANGNLLLDLNGGHNRDNLRGMQIYDNGNILLLGKGGNWNGGPFTFHSRLLNNNADFLEQHDIDLPSEEYASTTLALPDGKHLIVGYDNSGNDDSDVIVTRHLRNGATDTTFGTDGSVKIPVLNLGDKGFKAALQADGKIVLTGHSNNGDNWDLTVVRMTYDGQLDTDFNGNGKLHIPFSGENDYAYSILSLPDGKILVAGQSGNDIALVRLYGDHDIFGEADENPTLDPISDQTLAEDSTELSVGLTGISDGGDGTQPMRVTATSDMPSLLANLTVDYNSPDATGTLRLTPANDQFGTAVITVTVEDGGEDNDLNTLDDNETTSQSFVLTVTPVNDTPLLDPISDVTIDEDAIERSVNLTGIDAGGGESQNLRVTASSDDTGLIPTPAVDYSSSNATGTVRFTPLPDQFGTAIITVTVEDGGDDNNLNTSGDNLTFSRTFTVTVNPVNDVPLIDPVADVTIDEDASEQTIDLTGVLPGGGEGQELRVTASSNQPGLIPDPTVTWTAGGFEVLPAFDVAGELSEVTSDDYDGDGIVDLAVLSFGTDSVKILKGQQDGTFTLLTTLDANTLGITEMDGPQSVVSGDFDENGTPDLVVVCQWSGSIILLQNNGTADFEGFEIGNTGGSPRKVDSGDFNNDNVSDIVFVNANGSTDYGVLLGNGDGTFSEPIFGSVPGDNRGFAIADFDSDEILDLVIGDANGSDGSGDIYLVKGNGDGTFGGSIRYNVGIEPFGLNTADFNEDGLPDLVVGDSGPWDNSDPYHISVMLNDGLGGFAEPTEIPVGDGPAYPEIADFNNDGHVDIVVSNVPDSTVSVVYGDGHGQFSNADTYNVGQYSYGLAVNDFDADGHTDIAVANAESHSVNILLGQAEHSLSFTPVPDQFGTAVITVTVEDGGDDNDLDTTDDNLTTTESFTVNVRPINDEPLLDPIEDLTIDEDGGQQSVALTGIDAGGGESQNLRVMATSDNPGLITDLTVDYSSPDSDGTVRFTPLPDQFGTAVITVTVEDGGDDNNLKTTGDNLTFSRTFIVTVDPVNDAPLLDAIDDITIEEGPGEKTVELTGIDAGGGESQNLRVTATSDNTSLIPTPSIDYSSPNATGTLRFTPASDQAGTAIVTVTVEDGGDDNDLNTPGDNLTFSRTFTVTVTDVEDLGPVDFFRDEGVAVDGESWYEGSTSQAGLLTVLAEFDADSAGGDLEIQLLDDRKQWLASGSPVAGGLRFDYLADGGETFYLKLIGNQTDVDLRILNLVAAFGDTVTVSGTDFADDYTLSSNSTHRVVVHGIDYTFSSDVYNQFDFDGGDGSDSIWLGGTSGAESIELRLADTQLTGNGYTVQALNIGDVVFTGRGGADTATFYDTNTADTFISSPSWAKMVGSSYSHIVRGLPTVTAHATLGYDLAYMGDSDGNDTYETFSDRVVMTSDTHVATAIGFKRSSGTSTGGNDTATALDSAGNDRLLSYDDRIILYDGTHTHTSIDFGTNRVFASGQAGDVAYMFDSAGDDQMVARPGSTVITQSDRQTTAQGFAQSFAYSGTGNDTAEFYDTAGNNDYNGYLDRAVMKGDGIFLWGRGFDQMTGYFSGGSDRALMFDSEGDDTYVSGASDTTMSNESASNRVVGYTSIYAYSESGTDTATLNDTAGQETFRAYPDKAVLHGDDMFSWTRGFSQVTAHSSGGTDEAQLYDSAGHDTFRSEGATAQMSGDGYLNLAQGFLKNSGYSSGGTDTALMFDTSGDDLYRTYPTEVVMIGSGVTNAAYDFENTQGFSNTGTDSARLFDSAGDDQLMSYADRATLSGDGWANEVVGFDRNTVYGSSGYDQATMEDSTGDDLVKVRTIGPRLTQGDGTVFDVRTFDRILARSINGGEDIAELLDVDYEFELEGDWNS